MATKTTSVRAEEETIEKFDKLAEEYNITKTDLFPQLLEAYQEKKLKEKVPGRADDIDAFKAGLKQLNDLYFSSVDMAILAKTTAEQELKVELDTKTRTIADLQTKQDELKERIAELEAALNTATTENNRLTIEVGKLNDAINEKDTLIQSLKNNAAAVDAVGAIAELKEIVASMKKKEPKQAKEPEQKKK